jgi:hypothetical protein
MQLDKLVLDLRPRSNMAALDLGFTLLRVAPKSVWQVWLALWLPLMGLTLLAACLWPELATLLLFVPWWLRPLLERAPLYVLSRSVFGETVRWQEALKAFPRQLGGGLARLLLLRPLTVGRCLRQPIWQLEGARGKTAATRYHVISRQGAANSAVWFGVACAHFEVVLQIGGLGLISLFLPHTELINPFQIFVSLSQNSEPLASILISYTLFTLAGAIIGPVYTACGLTLYLNRRATLEAWDIEINLRQMQPPGQTPMSPMRPIRPIRPIRPDSSHSTPSSTYTASTVSTASATGTSGTTGTTGTMAVLLLLCLLGSSAPRVDAAEAPCTPPAGETPNTPAMAVEQHPQQIQLRSELDKLYQSEDLRDWTCEKRWRLRQSDPPAAKRSEKPQAGKNWLQMLEQQAGLIKLILIGIAATVALRFGWQFRSQWLGWLPLLSIETALPQVGGLDIRPQSLPDDVVQTALTLWRQQQQRAALALLYRATLSHLATQHLLQITPGATEADCLTLAKQAHLGHARAPTRPLPGLRWQVMQDCTALWLAAAWGNHWPDTAQIEQLCQQWQQAFVATATGGTAGAQAAAQAGAQP